MSGDGSKFDLVIANLEGLLIPNISSLSSIVLEGNSHSSSHIGVFFLSFLVHIFMRMLVSLSSCMQLKKLEWMSGCIWKLMILQSQRIGGASMTCKYVWVLTKLAQCVLEVCALDLN